MTASLSAPSAGRLSFVHGLRGVAAMLVVLFHLYYSTPVIERAGQTLPSLVDGLLRLGFLGVDLFFVISGYVIALTLRGRMSTAADGLRFFARRQLRLDPPYWAAIVASIASALALNHLRPGTNAPVPDVAAVVAHVFYLQDFLGYKPIVGVFWTLCMEVQFYLIMLAVSLFAARFRLGWRVLFWLLFPLFVLSNAAFWELVDLPTGLFVPRWFAFYIGVLLFLHGKGEIGWFELLLSLSLPLGFLLVSPATGNDIAAVTQATVLLIALSFLFAAQRKAMGRWLAGRVITWLGTISYSLYLVHAVVGIRAVKLLVGEHSSATHAWLMYAVGIALSLAFSELLYRLVEKPSIGLSHRIAWGGGKATRTSSLQGSP